MSNVENQVVSLEFDNAAFGRGIEQVLQNLEELKKGLDFSKAGETFDAIQSEAENVNFAGIESALENISSKFSAMGAVAFTVLQSVTNSALDAGRAILGAVTDPIVEGGARRAHAIEQAKFQFRGLGQDVEATMESALAAVEGTAYGLDEAATLAGVFGGAGIKAGEDLTGALRAVAGVSTITTARFSDIGAVFQNMAALGKVTMQDLNSLALRGLGFSKIADALGVSVEELRYQASQGLITFPEFAAAMDEAFGEHATRANETYSGALGNLRAAFARLGALFMEPQFEASRVFFNNLAPALDEVKNRLGPLVDLWKVFVNIQGIKAINFFDSLDFSQLDQWVPHIVRTFKNIYRAIGAFTQPIKDAFRDIFPTDITDVIGAIIVNIKKFTGQLTLSESAASKFRSIWKGVFSLFSILMEVVQGLGTLLAGVFGGLGSGIGSFGASLGEGLTAAKEFLVDGGRIEDFFANLGDKIGSFVKKIDLPEFFSKAASAVKDFFGIFTDASGGVDDGENIFERFQERLSGLLTVLGAVGKAYVAVVDFIIEKAIGIKNALEPVFEYLKETFGGIFESLLESLKDGDIGEVLDVLNVGILGAIAFALKKFSENDFGFNLDLFGSGGLVESMKTAFGALTTTLTNLQGQIKANTLMRIAKAVGILTISVIALSLIDTGDLTRALAAVATGMGQLVGAMALLDKIALTPMGAARLTILSVGMTILAGAMLLLAFAIRTLSSLSITELWKGLVGVGVGLALMVTFVKPLSTQAPGLITAALGITVLGVALNLVALAVKQMGKLDLGDLAKGLLGVAVSLGSILGATKFMPPNMFAIGAGLLLVGGALVVISGAVKLMSMMDWEEMGKGLTGLAGALIGIALAAKVMSSASAGAIAIGIMSVALIGLAIALKLFATLDWGEMLRGFFGMDSAISLLGAAALVLTPVMGTLAALGAALIPIAIGLGILGLAMQVFGQLSWAELGMALLGIAASMTVLGVASLLLAETIPFVLAFGAALVLLGAGFALIGAGAYLFARALQVISETSAEARESIRDFIFDTITMIPELFTELAEGVIAFLNIIFDAAPELIEGLKTVILDLLKALEEMAPQLAETLSALLVMMIEVARNRGPELIELGLFLLMEFIAGLRQNLPALLMFINEMVMMILVNIRLMVPMIVQAATDIIIAFITGLTASLGQIQAAAANLVIQLVMGISSNMGRVVTAATSAIIAFVNGIAANLIRVINAGVSLVKKLIEGVKNAALDLIRAGIDLALDFINGVADLIEEKAPELEAAAHNIGEAIGRGLAAGLSSMEGFVSGVFEGFMGGMMDRLGVIAGVSSPSTITTAYGRYIAEGLAKGIDQDKKAMLSANAFGTRIMRVFDEASSAVAAELDSLGEINPTITPVLDLSNIQRDANQISGLLGSPQFAAASRAQAQAIAFDTARQNGSESQTPEASEPQQLSFTQINHSPKALSTLDIYRDTKSLYALAKAELED